MNILSLDSSGDLLSVALSKDGEVFTLNPKIESKVSEIILITIDEILNINNISKEDINAIVFNKGPASFTGTRVSASIAQAIGFSRNIPAVGISSLSLMAYQYFKSSQNSNILCIKKAYSSKVYCAEFNIIDNNYAPIKPISLCEFSEINFTKVPKLYGVSNCWSNFSSNDNLNLENNIIKVNQDSNSDAELILEYVSSNYKMPSEFDLKETFPDYANHEL